MKKLRIAFLGTPDVSVPFLDKILNLSFCETAGVITQPDRPNGRGLSLRPSPVSVFAEKKGLKIYKPAKRIDLNRAVAELAPDIGFTVAYGRIISETALASAGTGFLNVHFSLLPKYRGAAPVQRSIMNGEKETGVSIFWLDKGMDTGPMCLQRKIRLPQEYDAGALFGSLSALGLEMTEQVLSDVAAGSVSRTPQEGEPSLAPMLGTEDSALDFNKTAEHNYNLVRGLSMGPQARFFILKNGSPSAVIVTAAGFSDQENGRAARGEITFVDKDGSVGIRCLSGDLILKTIKPEGKKNMPAAAFLNGLRLKKGSSLV